MPFSFLQGDVDLGMHLTLAGNTLQPDQLQLSSTAAYLLVLNCNRDVALFGRLVAVVLWVVFAKPNSRHIFMAEDSVVQVFR